MVTTENLSSGLVKPVLLLNGSAADFDRRAFKPSPIRLAGAIPTLGPHHPAPPRVPAESAPAIRRSPDIHR
jgi:hypothetical protein